MAQTDSPPAPLEAPPERGCYECGQTDNHPRIFVQELAVVDGAVQVVERARHYDCLPAGLRAQLTLDAGGQAGIDATAAGLRGADVQAAVHAAATQED